MKEYIFSDIELNLISFLQSNSPNKIWLEPLSYVFEYDDFYIELGVECVEIIRLDYISESKKENILVSDFEQYVMTTKLKKINQKFKRQVGSELLSKNEKISEINIVRTLLFYCQPKQSKQHSHFFNVYSSQINPSFQLKDELKVKETRLVDVGLWIRLDKKNINCFLVDNDDDFSENLFFNKGIDLKKTKKDIYSFIEINS